VIDIGLNLTHDSFDADRDAVLKRARSAGVTRMLVTGSSVAHSQKALDLVRQHPLELRATAGIHPHHANECNESTRSELLALLSQPEILAAGECGLDYFRNYSTPVEQEQAFRLQLEIATALRKPLFLHQRDAHEQFVGLLFEYRDALPGGVAHCFTAGVDEARTCLDLGLHIGITGWLCDERRGLHLKDVVKFVPAERLLVETDAPYLLPRDLEPRPKNRRNEPAFLPHIVAAIAHCRGEAPDVVAEYTTENALRLFGWT
jgi:TatD DNase family protein